MSASRASTSAEVAERNQALYREIVQTAAQGGFALMGKLAEAARLSLQTREAATRDLRERDALARSALELKQREAALCRAFPPALLQVFARPEPLNTNAEAGAMALHFDQLELMDEAHVRSSVAMARALQATLLVTEAALADLNALVCGLLGLSSVRAERNPLRPDVYAQTLKEVIAATGVEEALQTEWLIAMGPALGTELKALYASLSARLRGQGISAVGYALRRPAQGAVVEGGGYGPAVHGLGVPGVVVPGEGAQAPRSVDADRVQSEALLTLDKLRMLLSGELASGAQAGARVAQFSAQFDRQFEAGKPALDAPDSNFASTVPAALEALSEMKQVDRVVQNIQQRRAAAQEAPSAHAASVEGVRAELRRTVRDMAQALSLEVVTLMVDNMARDARLLPAMQAIIKSLEPALLRLALVDQRFFTSRQHPARRLLQEMTDLSLGFASEDTPGFADYVRQIENTLRPLLHAPVENAGPFEQALEVLQQAWSQAAQARGSERERAVSVLRHAEERNLLAEKIAHEVDAHADSGRMPAVVLDFLCGPWAQVLAQARLKEGEESAAAKKYQHTIEALMWSAHPEHAAREIGRLTKLVPRLLETLREGLATINYTPVKASAFLEKLMAIHQKAFRNARGVAAEGPATGQAPLSNVEERLHWLDQGNPWIAPQEAQSSNFLEIAAETQPEATAQPVDLIDLHFETPPASLAIEDLVLGAWVEIHKDGKWGRTQLTWASPHGTLFLFTSAFGTTQSMTRRSCDRLLASGQLRLVSAHTVVEGALDAVAHTAMRNSVDSKI